MLLTVARRREGVDVLRDCALCLYMSSQIEGLVDQLDPLTPLFKSFKGLYSEGILYLLSAHGLLFFEVCVGQFSKQPVFVY